MLSEEEEAAWVTLEMTLSQDPDLRKAVQNGERKMLTRQWVTTKYLMQSALTFLTGSAFLFLAVITEIFWFALPTAFLFAISLYRLYPLAGKIGQLRVAKKGQSASRTPSSSREITANFPIPRGPLFTLEEDYLPLTPQNEIVPTKKFIIWTGIFVGVLSLLLVLSSSWTNPVPPGFEYSTSTSTSTTVENYADVWSR